jgi:hypothetical protein
VDANMRQNGGITACNDVRMISGRASRSSSSSGRRRRRLISAAKRCGRWRNVSSMSGRSLGLGEVVGRSKS